MRLQRWHSVDSGVAMIHPQILHQVLKMNPQNELLWSA